MNNMEWVDQKEAEIKKASAEGYFDIVEGDNRIQLLTHCAAYPVKWTGSKYEPAQEGDTGVSIKGVCLVLHDGKIKDASLPYTVVKAVRELMQDPDYAFVEFPMPRLINIKAKNAGTKEVEYTVIPSPRETPVSAEILKELAQKPTPEEMVEKKKGKVASGNLEKPQTEELNPENIPF